MMLLIATRLNSISSAIWVVVIAGFWRMSSTMRRICCSFRDKPTAVSGAFVAGAAPLWKVTRKEVARPSKPGWGSEELGWSGQSIGKGKKENIVNRMRKGDKV